MRQADEVVTGCCTTRFLHPWSSMRLSSVAEQFGTLTRSEAAALAVDLVRITGVRTASRILTDGTWQAQGQQAQLDLLPNAIDEWVGDCESVVAMLIQCVAVAATPAHANLAAQFTEPLRVELRIAWTGRALRLSGQFASQPAESVAALAALAAQADLAQRAVAALSGDRVELAAAWDVVVADMAHAVAALHERAVTELGGHDLDEDSFDALVAASVAVADLSGGPVAIDLLRTRVAPSLLATRCDVCLAAVTRRAWHPRWSEPLLRLAERACEAAGRAPDLERALALLIPFNAEALRLHIARLTARGSLDEARFWLSEAQAQHPRADWAEVGRALEG